MRYTIENNIRRILACILLFLVTTILVANDGLVPNCKIQLSKNKDTIYNLLKQVSDQSGYLFIYDSQIIDNDKQVKIPKGEYTLNEAIYTITGNKKLKITVIGNHILLQLPDIKHEKTIEDTLSAPSYITVSGIIYDQITNEPLPYSSIQITNSTIGTISNQDGEFKLILPDSLSNSFVKLTHVGYQSQELEVSLLNGNHIRFSLIPQIIPLQEVIVRTVDPIQELKSMLAQRMNHYSSSPTYLTTFYREGANYRKKNIDLIEAVLKVYKTGYRNSASSDQVKLMKMRKIKNRLDSDTIFTKMKSGINSSLILDIMKNLPAFLEIDGSSPFDYIHTDISVIDGRRINIISFEQKKHIIDPLFKGQLFIDAENKALIEARFEINPKYVEKATNTYVEKQNRDFSLTLQRAQYIVSYKLSNDNIYYINHIRGDLDFKVRKKRRLFSSPLHLWFEMVTCKIETNDVNSFSKKEKFPTRNVFSDTKYKYDRDFWGQFNVILPEEKLKELIINNLSEILEE